jgi:hypothetical protein
MLRSSNVSSAPSPLTMMQPSRPESISSGAIAMAAAPRSGLGERLEGLAAREDLAGTLVRERNRPQ